MTLVNHRHEGMPEEDLVGLSPGGYENLAFRDDTQVRDQCSMGMKGATGCLYLEMAIKLL